MKQFEPLAYSTKSNKIDCLDDEVTKSFKQRKSKVRSPDPSSHDSTITIDDDELYFERPQIEEVKQQESNDDLSLSKTRDQTTLCLKSSNKGDET